jgi:aspartyl-tRNA(Asn)/glutamyl-tRNA(Gln) amidotransferase subunit A
VTVTADPSTMTLSEAAASVRARRVSPVELLEDTLRRIDDLDPAINAFIEVFAERATAAAAEAEREIVAGRHRGPLHGIPIALKDVLAVRGEVCAGASRILAGHVAAESSAVVERLLAAGAVPLGRLNMHEFAFGVTSENPHYGSVCNPWDAGRMAGGSSGGAAAAVAARLCCAAVGTDTGCSIRLPAAFSGCVGLRPTIGRVSTRGTIPLAWTLDTVGPLARTAEDAALLFEVLAGHDPRDPISADRSASGYAADLADGTERPHLGVLSPQATDRLQPAVREAFEAALGDLEAAGATVEPVELGDLGPTTASLRTINLAEPVVNHAGWLRERPQDYGEDVRARLEAGAKLTAAQYLEAQRHRGWLAERLRPSLERFDALLTPTAPLVAPRLGANRVKIAGEEEPLVAAAMRFNALPALAGLPALSVPCGFATGMPVGLQIVSRPFAELTVLRIAHAYQAVTGWHSRDPLASHDLSGES